MIPYGKHCINDEDIQAVIDVLRSDYLTQGPKVAEFESKFSSYVGSKYAVAVSNGTTALHLSASALGLKNGQRILTTPITFVASANCALYCGADVDFVDIDPKSLCMDINKLEDTLKKSPNLYSGIVPVDFAGYPIQMDDFSFLAEKYNLWIIEDACHAPGARFKGKNGHLYKSGSGEFTDVAVFSFHPVKHIACGEGGMITTNDSELFQKLQILRTHGITKDPLLLSRNEGSWYYEMQELGFNYRIPDMLCALGLSQLNRADSMLERRRQIAQVYFEELKDSPVELPHVDHTIQHAFHLFVIQTDRRKELFDYLKSQEIFAQVHYIPVHKQPYFEKRYGFQTFEESERFYQRCLSLPIYPSMTNDQLNKVIKSIKNFFLNG